MKTIVLTALFLSLNTFAHVSTVEVVIDGQVYSCVGGGTIGNSCADATKAADAKVRACRSSGFSSTECFRNSFPRKIENCKEWSELCSSTCRSTGFSSTECFNTCY